MYELDSNEPPSRAVVAAVAERTGRSPLELEPLADSIDPDALDAMLDAADGTGSEITVSFAYCGYTVTATPGGVRIDERDP